MYYLRIRHFLECLAPSQPRGLAAGWRHIIISQTVNSI